VLPEGFRVSVEAAVHTVPIARPLVTEEDCRRVLEVLSSGRLSSGEWVERFETSFAAYVGVPYAVATSSGTAALEVVLEALGVGPGDGVVVPAFTFAATANAVVHRGARPVFVDIDPATFNLDPQAVEEALKRNPRVRGVVAVHLYGLPAAVDSLLEVADGTGCGWWRTRRKPTAPPSGESGWGASGWRGSSASTPPRT
jgi:perosamine synthetase